VELTLRTRKIRWAQLQYKSENPPRLCQKAINFPLHNKRQEHGATWRFALHLRLAFDILSPFFLLMHHPGAYRAWFNLGYVHYILLCQPVEKPRNFKRVVTQCCFGQPACFTVQDELFEVEGNQML
jgi:hypothetical protein